MLEVSKFSNCVETPYNRWLTYYKTTYSRWSVFPPKRFNKRQIKVTGFLRSMTVFSLDSFTSSQYIWGSHTHQQWSFIIAYLCAYASSHPFEFLDVKGNLLKQDQPMFFFSHFGYKHASKPSGVALGPLLVSMYTPIFLKQPSSSSLTRALCAFKRTSWKSLALNSSLMQSWTMSFFVRPRPSMFIRSTRTWTIEG